MVLERIFSQLHSLLGVKQVTYLLLNYLVEHGQSYVAQQHFSNAWFESRPQLLKVCNGAL